MVALTPVAEAVMARDVVVAKEEMSAGRVKRA